jgi:hypothetical protein
MYSFKTLLMMGVKSTRDMQSAVQGTIKTTAPSCIKLVVLFINILLAFVSVFFDYVVI